MFQMHGRCAAFGGPMIVATRATRRPVGSVSAGISGRPRGRGATLTDQRGTIIELDDLDHTEHAHEFVGAEHGDVPFSVILVHSRPGVGPKLHRHPYAEVFVVESGQATFQIGDDTVVVDGGHVVVSPPGEAHGFTNTGTGELRLTAIHGAGAVRHRVARRPRPRLDVEARRVAKRRDRSPSVAVRPRGGGVRDEAGEHVLVGGQLEVVDARVVGQAEVVSSPSRPRRRPRRW